MPDELKVLRDLRPGTSEPTEELSLRAREALISRIEAGPRGHRSSTRRLRGRPLRRWVVPCLVIVGLGATGVGLAGGLQDWWMSGDPPVRSHEVADILDFSEFGPPPTESRRAEPDISRAVTVARAPGAALVAAPSATGGYCLVPLPERGEPSFICIEGDEVPVGQLLFWIDRGGDEAAWYFLGRVEQGASRVELLGHVTHPLDRGGAETLPGTPLAVDVGPGGFFLARMPEELWQELNLAYSEMTVLGEDGTILARACRFLGPAPDSSLTSGGIGSVGGPLRPNPAGGDSSSCPPTGSAREAAMMTAAPARAADVAGIAGRDFTTGEEIRLSRFVGRPLLLVVWQPYSGTAVRLLRELDTFALRHPEVHVVGVLGDPGEPLTKRAYKELGLSFPTIAVRGYVPALERNAPGAFFGHQVLVADVRGRVVLELASRENPPLGTYGLVTPEVLDEALASVTD